MHFLGLTNSWLRWYHLKLRISMAFESQWLYVIGPTVDGCEILHQLMGYPIIYRAKKHVSTIQSGAGFRNHPPYVLRTCAWWPLEWLILCRWNVLNSPYGNSSRTEESIYVVYVYIYTCSLLKQQVSGCARITRLFEKNQVIVFCKNQRINMYQ